MFFLPISLAYVLNVVYPGFSPLGHSNLGELVQPARPISADGLEPLDGRADPLLDGHWTLVVVARRGCEAACAEALRRMRQNRLALGKDMDRVQRVLVVPAGAPRPDVEAWLRAEPGVRVVTASAQWDGRLRGEDAVVPGLVYLIDPQNFVILRYDLDHPDSAMVKDLKRVLRVSKIG